MRQGRLKIKIQVTCGNEFAMGPGKAELLQAIDERGSISAAGRAMGMSYRRAWLLVDEMNRSFAERLVATNPGGGPQGGARVTDAGRAIVAAFRDLERETARVTDHPSYRVLVEALKPDPPEPENKPT